MNYSLRLAAFLAPILACAGCATQAAPAAEDAATPAEVAATPIHLEAEDAQLTGAKVLSARKGFSGKGYISNLSEDGDNIKWTFNADKAGIYEARVRYSSPFGSKGTELVVNGKKTGAKLAETKDVFATASLGKVKLKQGENSVTMNKGWGFYDVDALDFLPDGAATAPASAKSIHLEAENAKLTGPKVETTRKGFSGKGYVSGFTKDGDNIQWTLPVEKAGIYDARVRYSSPNGEKGTEIVVNGVKTSGKLPETKDVFATASLGKIELKAGENTIAIGKGWGYYDIDALDFISADDVATVVKPPATLNDPQATLGARDLMKYLVSQYGEKTLSGQYETEDNDYLAKSAGVTPAVFGGDLMRYSPSFIENGAKPKGISEGYIKRAQAGQILTLSWHWNAPSHLINKNYLDKDGKEVQALWWSGFYTRATTFDLEAALANPDGKDYKLLMRDIDQIAIQLKKFEDAGIPVLWRPLHEAEGGWFWWGAKGPEPFKKLWRLMYDRLTVKHDLHNLIWVYTTEGKDNWYPGDDVVDMVGADCYPSDLSDPLSSTWQALNAKHGGKKLIALCEFGGVADVEKMKQYGVRWSYFATWNGKTKDTPLDKIKALYKAPDMVNQKDLLEGISH